MAIKKSSTGENEKKPKSKPKSGHPKAPAAEPIASVEGLKITETKVVSVTREIEEIGPASPDVVAATSARPRPEVDHAAAIVPLLLPGKPMHAEAIAERTGLHPDDVHRTLRALDASGHVASQPHFFLTTLGARALATPTDPEGNILDVLEAAGGPMIKADILAEAAARLQPGETFDALDYETELGGLRHDGCVALDASTDPPTYSFVTRSC